MAVQILASIQGSRRTAARVLSSVAVSPSKGHRGTEKIKKKKATKTNQKLEKIPKIPDSEALEEIIH